MYITEPKDAEFLTQIPVFVTDIETNTDSPIKSWKDYGLSYATDMTWISFSSNGNPTVVFDMNKELEGYSEKIEFLKRVFCREGYVVVGHNVIFDLRLILGHLGIQIPLGSLVHDTLTMAIMLLMPDDVKSGVSLASLATKYNLYASQEELEFSTAMKAKRFELHTVAPEQVLRYVALDTDITLRLYNLQRAIIETSGSPTIKPTPIIDGSVFRIENMQATDKQPFAMTKNWSNLQELVNWEYRISRWCGNQSARGIRLDHEYLAQHRQQLMQEYSEAFNTLNDVISNVLPKGAVTDFGWLLHYNRLLTFYVKRKRRPDMSQYTYGNVSNFPKPENVAKYMLLTQYPNEWADFLNDTENGQIPTIDPFEEPQIDLVQWAMDNVILNEPDSKYRRIRAEIFVDWYTLYFNLKVLVSPSKVVGRALFKLFYVFVVQNKKFPDNSELIIHTELVTPALQRMIDEGAEIDYQETAITERCWAISADSLEYYFGRDTDDPFCSIVSHQAKINRVDEFERHASKDGRIHTIIARKTQTGRASSVAMNLQNIKMKDFRGYLVPDDDGRVFVSIDISNAENWLLAMTFGDSTLAQACAGGDFHSQMTKIYWPELSKMLLEQGRLDEFNALRKKSKFVTFGSAYGAGPKKIAKMIGTSIEEARTLLANRDARFINYSTGREKLTDRVAKCYRDGFRPAFTTLWSGRRIAIPMRLATRKEEVDGKIVIKKYTQLAAYKAINYLPQGGVGEIIWRAIVLASEHFERSNIDAHVSLQVHDELVIDCTPENAFEVSQFVIETIANIIPQKFLERTVPACRMLSEVGPENSKKFGWRGLGKPYLLPMDKFVNRWGIHDMPEGEDEAPTWVGNYDAGYNVADEIRDTLAKQQSDMLDRAPEKIELKTDSRWKQFDDIVVKTQSTLMELNEHRSMAWLYVGSENKGLYDFPNRMLASQEMIHKGLTQPEEYDKVWSKIKQLKAVLEQFEVWYKDNTND